VEAKPENLEFQQFDATVKKILSSFIRFGFSPVTIGYCTPLPNTCFWDGRLADSDIVESSVYRRRGGQDFGTALECAAGGADPYPQPF